MKRNRGRKVGKGPPRNYQGVGWILKENLIGKAQAVTMSGREEKFMKRKGGERERKNTEKRGGKK